MNWKDRWNPPGRNWAGEEADPRLRDMIRVQNVSAGLPPHSDLRELLRAVEALLSYGQGDGDLDAVVRADEILRMMPRELHLPKDTWAIVKTYNPTGSFRPGESVTLFACYTEGQCRVLASAMQEEQRRRSQRHGWLVDSYEARQVDDARPNMLLRADVGDSTLREWMRVTWR